MYCNKCGKSMVEEKQFCTSCEDTVTKSQKKPLWFKFLIVGIVLTVILGSVSIAIPSLLAVHTQAQLTQEIEEANNKIEEAQEELRRIQELYEEAQEELQKQQELNEQLYIDDQASSHGFHREGETVYSEVPAN